MSKDFINSNKNDSFAFLRGLDLQELLIQTESCFLEYRDSLNLPENLTIGVEIEYEDVSKEAVDEFIDDDLFAWYSGKDSSLDNGGEIRSPIMFDNNKYWQELKMICEFLTSKKANTTGNAGGHIHIGACILGDDVEAWKQFIKVYAAYENILFRFYYGDKIRGRKSISGYARPIAAKLYNHRKCVDTAKSMAYIKEALPLDDRYFACNFRNVQFDDLNNRSTKNTIELRCPNATTEAVIWQNNINAFAKMLVSSKAKVMDEEFLSYKLEHEFIADLPNGPLYNVINLKNALEFVDLIFDNNLDKVYFLRQYLKNFQEKFGDKDSVRVKSFIK